MDWIRRNGRGEEKYEEKLIGRVMRRNKGVESNEWRGIMRRNREEKWKGKGEMNGEGMRSEEK